LHGKNGNKPTLKSLKKSGISRILAPQKFLDYAIITFIMGGDKVYFISISRKPAYMRILRNSAITLLLLAITTPVLAAVQESVGINFFDLARADAGSPTCWDGQSYSWIGSPTTVLNCSGGSGGTLPVTSVDGIGSINFTTTRPGGSGWGNIQFKIDGGHTVNFLRYGSSPYLYLRLKWGVIAAGASFNIALYDNHSIWNSNYIYNAQPGPYIDNSAVVALSNYVTPSTTAWQDVYIPMTDFLANNPLLDLTKISILEFQTAGNYSTNNTMYAQKIKIVPDVDFAHSYSDMVKVNLIGYLPNQKKLAIVSYEVGTVTAPTYFQVLDANTGVVVYQANLALDTPYSSSWDRSGDTVYRADFTAFTTPGRYVIYSPELDQVSQPFDIGKKVFDKIFRDGLRFFYYGRCSTDINEPYAEGHTRPAVYKGTSPYDYDDNDPTKMYDYDPNNTGRITNRSLAGGWFDAGDLHRDIHNNVGTMWLLLQTYKQFKNKLGPNTLNLPESNGQTNDLVFLIKWELDWFKKMQNTDGSVHFIVISEGDVTLQKVSDVSTSSAAILAGIFAKASTLFADVPGMESYSADLLTRAQLSWTWLMAHTATYNPRDPSNNLWSYGNWSDDTSHRVFAASALYDATGDTTYRTYFESKVSTSNPLSLPGASYGGYIGPIGQIFPPAPAYIDYIDTARPVDEAKRTALKNLFLTEAATIDTSDIRTSYSIPLIFNNSNGGDLFWGSSGQICSNAYTLLRAYEWTGNTAYLNDAVDAIDWICGRNPVSRIFVTGDYTDYLHGTDIYSFFWFDYLDTVPGYLCGNINHAYGSTSRTYPNANIKYKDKYYLNVQNAATLEPCIHWQAEMCYLLGYFAYDMKMPKTVDYTYIGQFAQAWLSTPASGNWNPNFDLSEPSDGIVDFLDFAVIANHWLEVN
jgi:hypothetical protein